MPDAGDLHWVVTSLPGRASATKPKTGNPDGATGSQRIGAIGRSGCLKNDAHLKQFKVNRAPSDKDGTDMYRRSPELRLHLLDQSRTLRTSRAQCKTMQNSACRSTESEGIWMVMVTPSLAVTM